MSALLKDARQVRASLERDWAAHLKICRDCSPLTDTRNRYCPPGWELTKQLHAARRQVDTLEAGCGDQSLTLF